MGSARDEEVALFGTSAKYLDALHKQGYAPINTHDPPALRLICSTDPCCRRRV